MPTGKAASRVSASQEEGHDQSKEPRRKELQTAATSKRSPGRCASGRGGFGGKSKGTDGGKCATAGGKKGVEKKRATGAFRGQSQSCHQCRQSIHSNKGVSEVKSGRERLKCSTCTRFWCEQCLLNRYGIVKATVAVETWACPVCSKNCNCSLCRRKEGKLATGILTPLAKVAGFGSVSDFLSDGTDDIARILQWQSTRQPPGCCEKKGKRKESNGDATSSSKPRKRRRVPDTPLTPSLSPTPPTPPSSHSHGARDGVRNGVSCHGNGVFKPKNNANGLCSGDVVGVGCHGNRSKRQQLQHSNYNITIEEADVQSAEVNLHPQVVISESGGGDENVEGGPMENLPMTPTDEPSSDSSVSFPLSSPSQILSPSSPSVTPSEPPSLQEQVNVFAWRSPRQRITTQRFTSENFRESSKEKGKSKSPRGARGKQFGSSGWPTGVVECCEEEWEKKQGELDTLRNLQLDSLRFQHETVKQLWQEERVRERERERERRREGREQREELRRLAREVTRGSREATRREKEEERGQRIEKLQQLKLERMEQRRQIKDLSFLLPHPDSLLLDDSLQACNEQGIPPLPNLPLLVLPIATYLVPRFLSIAEFLATFSEILKLRNKPSAESLAKTLLSEQGPIDVYQKLLRLVVTPYDELRSEFKGHGHQWEKLAVKYLHALGKTGPVRGEGVKGEGESGTSPPCEVEYRLVILEQLVEEALTMPAIVSKMEVAIVIAEQVRKEGRALEKGKTKFISDDLRGLRTMEDMEQKKKEIIEELSLIHRETHDKQYRSLLLLRNSCLGEDRLGRKYWRLQCVAGVVVEQTSCGYDGCRSNEDKGCSDDEGWLHINTEALLTEFVSCLHSSGRRESVLQSHLHTLRHIITNSLLTT